MAAPAVTAQQFLEALYEGIGAGFIEIRPLLDGEDPRKGSNEGKKLQSDARRWFRWPNELEKCVAYFKSINGKDFHMYYGVALRKNTTGGSKSDVGCCTAVFADVDFKDVTPEETKKLLREFPFKPSLIMKSGNGVHVYWLLMEPATASSFEKLESINKRMLAYLKAQRGPQDVSRVLRLPGTVNIKKKYPDPKPITEVTWFRPENRYILDDFEQYLPEAAPTKTYSVPAPHAHSGNGASTSASPQEPDYEIDEELVDEAAMLIKKVWSQGSRHLVALHVAGWCAHAGYTRASAERLMLRICELAEDAETDDRLAAVRDSYAKYMAGQKVSGYTSLQKLIEDSFSEVVAEQLLKGVQLIRKSALRVKKNGQSSGAASGGAPAGGGTKKLQAVADFRLVKAVKFDSRPARYNVTVEKNGHEVLASCDTTSHFFIYPRFQELVYEQTDIVLTSPLKPGQWLRMIEDLGVPDVREAPREARPDGALDSALDEFLQDSKENPEIGILKKFAGYDEDATFFRGEAFMDFLIEKGLKVTSPHLSDRLRGMDWDNVTRRFGRKVVRMWVKKGPPQTPSHDPGVTPKPVTGGQSTESVAAPVTPQNPKTDDLFPETSQENAF